MINHKDNIAQLKERLFEYPEEQPHGPTVFNYWRNEVITTTEAMGLLGKTKESWEAYVNKMSHWCCKEVVYQDCCDYINKISSKEFKASLVQTFLNYTEDEMVEKSDLGISSFISGSVTLK